MIYVRSLIDMLDMQLEMKDLTMDGNYRDVEIK